MSPVPASAATPQAPPLLLVCALGIERIALRGGAAGNEYPGGRPAAPGRGLLAGAGRPWRWPRQRGALWGNRGAAGRGGGVAGPGPALGLLRTGMGPAAATRAMAAALRRDERAAAAVVLVTGFCAGLVPGMRPGDIVVADEVWSAAEAGGRTGPPIVCGAAGQLASALSGRGLTVHIGPVCSSSRLVRGAARARLRSQGAVAADMESAATLGTVRTTPGGGWPALRRPVAAARVVVDTPERELARPGTLLSGMIAFGALRAAVPAFVDWHRVQTPSWASHTKDDSSNVASLPEES